MNKTDDKSATAFDWNARCAYDPVQKRRFHAEAVKRLRLLAADLDLELGGFDLRTNRGGVAVSGEVTLHHEQVYVQVAQSVAGPHGLLIRSCRGLSDYDGGRNHQKPLSLLDDREALRREVSRIGGFHMPQDDLADDYEEDASYAPRF